MKKVKKTEEEKDNIYAASLLADILTKANKIAEGEKPNIMALVPIIKKYKIGHIYTFGATLEEHLAKAAINPYADSALSGLPNGYLNAANAFMISTTQPSVQMKEVFRERFFETSTAIKRIRGTGMKYDETKTPYENWMDSCALLAKVFSDKSRDKKKVGAVINDFVASMEKIDNKDS